MVFHAYSTAEELLRAKCIGDRVNVRVRPDTNSEIVTQLSSGEDVIVIERKDEPSSCVQGLGEWAKIKAPRHTKCWVKSEFIEGEKIKTDSTNLRCGPGIAFPVLVKLKKGTPINIVEVFGEWVRIIPPVEFGVWVSSKYLEYEPQITQIKPQITQIKPQITQIEPPEVVKEKVVEEKPKAISVPEGEITGVELISYAGKLEDLGIIINRPGTYKLVSEEGKWICIIRSPTLDVNPYVNRVVRIDGVILSKSSSWNVPVVEVKRLSVIR